MNKNYKLQTKLILSFTILASFIIGLISISVNFGIEKEFKNYVIEKHNEKVDILINNLIYSYETSDGFNISDIEHLGVEAIEQGLIIDIVDSNHESIWSALDHNAGLCESMISNVRDNMFDHYSDWSGDYTEETFPLISNHITFAGLTIGYLGPYYFNEEELFFLNVINKILIAVGIIALVLSIFIGYLISRSITKPMYSIIAHLNKIHSDKESLSIPIKTGAREIQQLSESALSLEKRIIEQQQLRKQLTQDMAHELKTPLSVVQGLLEAMIDGIFEATYARLTSCHEEILRIKSLITEVECLSIAENNNLSLNYVPSNLLNVLDDIRLFQATRLNSQNQRLNISVLDPTYNKLLAQYPCDPTKLKQVFINLIDNSIKYAGDNAIIDIALEISSNNTLLITYSDNGIGIPDKDLPYIFERFYRVDTSRTGHNGLGIGLTLVKSIIEKHQGTIQIKDCDQGTTFVITIPYTKTSNLKQKSHLQSNHFNVDPMSRTL